MSVNKSHLTTILELSNPKKIYKALHKKYCITNVARLCQLLRDCQAISTQKNISVIKKFETMLNFNAEICIQKPEFAFRDKHLINFLVASMSSTYENIIDNLNMCKTLILEETFCALQIKETELNNLVSIKNEKLYFAGRRGFCGVQVGQGEQGG